MILWHLQQPLCFGPVGWPGRSEWTAHGCRRLRWHHILEDHWSVWSWCQYMEVTFTLHRRASQCWVENHGHKVHMTIQMGMVRTLRSALIAHERAPSYPYLMTYCDFVALKWLTFYNLFPLVTVQFYSGDGKHRNKIISSLAPSCSAEVSKALRNKMKQVSDRTYISCF